MGSVYGQEFSSREETMHTEASKHRRVGAHVASAVHFLVLGPAKFSPTCHLVVL